jgi:hypothetical protein
MKPDRSKQIVKLLKKHIFKGRNDLDVDVCLRLNTYNIEITVNYSPCDGIINRIIKTPDTSKVKQKIRSVFGIKEGIFLVIIKNYNKIPTIIY